MNSGLPYKIEGCGRRALSVAQQRCPALDVAMFSDTAAVTEERPAGLLNGIAALTPTAAVAGIKADTIGSQERAS